VEEKEEEQEKEEEKEEARDQPPHRRELPRSPML
jgi:hypothetical protein